MSVADVRRYTGTAWGPVRNARIIDLSGGDFVDRRGFVWQAETAGSYSYRPESASGDLTVTLQAGEYPTVGGVSILCSAVRQRAGLLILAANL